MTSNLPAIIPAEGEEDLTELPPFEGLTRMQSAFVRCYVEHGTGNATQAARDAGYAEVSCHAMGYRLLRNGTVARAILAHTAHAFSASAPVALATMNRLLRAKSEFVQQQAAADLMDRAGFRPADRVKVGDSSGSITVTIDLG